MDGMERPGPTGPIRAPRFGTAIAACVAMLCCAWQAAASNSPQPPTSTVHSVWNAEVNCSGAASIMKVRHPDEALFRDTGHVVLAGTGYAFAVPALAGLPDSVVLLVHGDRSRGVVEHYILLARDDLNPPVAAVVVTELPEGLEGKDLSTLLATASGQVSNARTLAGLPVTFTHVYGPTGPAIEMLVPGRVGSTCYPTSHFTLVEDDLTTTLGISLFTIDGPYLVEYSLIVPTTGGMPSDSITFAREELRKLVASLARLDGSLPGLTSGAGAD